MSKLRELIKQRKPDATEEELDQIEAKASDKLQLQQTQTEPLPEESKAQVYDYIRNKYFNDFSDDKRQEKLEEANRRNNSLGMKVGEALAGFGQSMQMAGGARRGIDLSYFDNLRKDNRDQIVGEFDRGKENALKNFQVENTLKEAELKEARRDPNSEYSKQFIANAEKALPGLAGKLSGLSVEEAEKLMPTLTRQLEAQTQRDFQLQRDEANRAHQSKLKNLEIASRKGKTEKITPDMRKAAGFAVRTKDSAGVIDSLEDFARKTPNFNVLDWNILKSEERQRLDNAANDFIAATLRRESGAAISDKEMEDGKARYIPQIGDSLEVLEQKRKNRQNIMASLQSEAGDVAMYELYQRRDQIEEMAPKPKREGRKEIKPLNSGYSAREERAIQGFMNANNLSQEEAINQLIKAGKLPKLEAPQDGLEQNQEKVLREFMMSHGLNPERDRAKAIEILKRNGKI